MKIQACIFDLFGTLVPVSRKSDYYGSLAAVPQRLGMDEAAFRREWDATYLQRNDGTLPTLEANVRAICTSLGAAAEDAEIASALGPFRRLMRETLRPKPESAGVLQEIARRGYPLGLISNCNPDVPELFRRGPLASHFRVAVFSSEAGAAKPAPGVYLEATRQLGVEPRACLYIGDGHGRELAGAAAVGMVTALLDNHQPDGYIFDRDEAAAHALAGLSEVLPLLDALESGRLTLSPAASPE